MHSGIRSCLRAGVALLLGCVLTVAQAAIDKLPAGVSQGDWQQIQAQIASQRQRFEATPEGYRAEQVARGWQMTFDFQGFLVRPKQSEGAGRDWHWGLALKSYGVGSQEQAIAATPRLVADGRRLDYHWNAKLTEWLINDAKGLEHGFTLSERPSGNGDTLYFSLAVRGDLRAQARLGGQSVAFVDANGQSVLNYAGLKVFDARGREMPARLSVQANVIQLAVDDRRAVYPLTIDPIAQQAYLKASNTRAGDNFGSSVAIDGDTLVVGSPFEDSNATAGQMDNSAGAAGAVYVFVRSGGIWTQQAYLKASNAEAADQFGYSVAISGNTIVVGAYGEDSNATDVNGNQADNSASGADAYSAAGAAYVFTRSGTTWSQQAYLKASNTEAGDNFGYSVAISVDTIVVGARGEDSVAIGVGGNQADNSADFAGAAYVFTRSGGTWSQQAYLKASNTWGYFEFGRSVAISGETIVVGAFGETSNATGVNGDQTNRSLLYAGAAYVFTRNVGVWSQQAYLKASNTEANDQFGCSVALSGDTAVIGACREASSATGVNGNQADNSADTAGAAYVFVRDSTTATPTWSQQAYLKASNAEADEWFGFSVAISGDTIVVVAVGEGSRATGVDGDQTDNSAGAAGAGYVFVRDSITKAWSQQAYLKASNTGVDDYYGWSVAISGDTVVVGAVSEDSNATGVNGSQADDSASNAGAAYVFKLNADVTPDAFSFTAQSGVALSAAIESNAITVSGIDASAPISISGGSYKIGSGTCTSTAGTVSPGDSVKVCLASSASYNTLSSATLNIGGVTADFEVTTTRYVLLADGTVWDSDSELIWDQCTFGLSGNDCSIGTSIALGWDDAQNFALAANLSHYKGHNDWVVPIDLESLDDTTTGSHINTTFFPNTQCVPGYWSSSEDPPGNAIYTESCTFQSDSAPKTEQRHVRLVRSTSFLDPAGNLEPVVIPTPAFSAVAGASVGGKSFDFFDVNAGDAISIRLSAAGTFTLGSIPGATITGNGSSLVTITGVAASAVINNYSYSYTAPASGSSDTLSFTVDDDHGGTGIGFTPVSLTSSNANLAGLSLSSGSLSPSFAAGTTSYSATVANGISTITVTPTVADANATVKVNGATVTSGTASGAINLVVGSNTITVVVTAQDGTTSKTYTVTVTRAASATADLSGLSLSSGSLSPSFAAGTTSYSATVANGISTVTVTPTVADASSTVKVNNVAVISGSASGAINLAVGSNTIPVVVTAPDNSTKTYAVTVMRQAQTTYIGSLPGGGQATANISSSGAACGFASAAFVSLASVSATPPAGYNFSNGLFQFSLTGCPVGQPVQVAITYPSTPGSVYWKYGPTPGDPSNHWYQIPATVSGNTISFTVIDGGLGDDDLNANGSIVDAGGPAIPPSTAAVPTLSEWALLLMAGLVGLLGTRSRWRA